MPPQLSLLTVLDHPSRDAFERTVRAVLPQAGDWEWLLADPQDTPWVRERLAELTAAEPRVRVVEAANGAGLAAAAHGEYVAVLGQHDRLHSRALERIGAALATDGYDVVYGDEGMIDEAGERRAVHRRPEWSPERLRHQDYLGRLTVVRRSTLASAGGLGATDDLGLYDLHLRISEHTDRVARVPYILCETPVPATDGVAAATAAREARIGVVQQHLDRSGIEATAGPGKLPELVQVDRRPDATTTVSVIIPTIGTRARIWGEPRTLVTETVRSMAESSRRHAVEFVVVYDDPTPPAVLDELRAIPGVTLQLVPFHEKFNFAAKCNVGAIKATGDVLVFLNDDVQASGTDVLDRLVAPLREPEVGATGAKLLFEDGRIQHAGVRYGPSVYHAYYREPADSPGALGELWVNREVSALTGACLAVRRSDYWAVGGFSESLPSNYNDVDLCFKLRRDGLRLLWLHDVVLHHFESVTRDGSVSDWEMATIEARWGDSDKRERFVNNVRTLRKRGGLRTRLANRVRQRRERLRRAALNRKAKRADQRRILR
ncbi:glycosyltransferase [Nocardioides sp. CER19]|uniref:glycosyltransferase family 2 protein n=1 Tax=Nocardioides sp. CER19 TaxID=3038538 RepID=UPI00244785B8|nr:glycosyltransferase [Nocardioides sp. CER19]MDH2416914.1 glycosyltransferase [Nocardioides sp. CER19]